MDSFKITVYAGQYLSRENTEFMSVQELQKAISEEHDGYYVEQTNLSQVLDALCICGFLSNVGEFYTFANKTITNTTVVKNVMPFLEKEKGFLNLEFSGE